ncbi:MAG TPA: cytochrome o ubiquinol oxidase subunit IV [Hyphomicrobium sp.]|jgi:cytochrome o ubiquinol oxidase operon protein cyoD|nr:cytochrome o ubiquinol oxidase subunit IV [Hyphomicrobium sp.]
MSTEAHADHSNSHAAHHGHHGHGGEAHATFGGYMIGFGLSVVLTAIPFWLVMSGVLGSNQATALAIIAFAVVQIVVHMIFFLHMSPRSEDGWTMMALIFTLVMVLITLAGSLWVMYHLNTNMMPSHDMSQLP